MIVCPRCKFYNICKGRLNETVEHCVRFKSVDITNEEWFCSLPTEEKAKVFANATYSTAETPLTILWAGAVFVQTMSKEAEQKKWELWLKQPHTDKE